MEKIESSIVGFTCQFHYFYFCGHGFFATNTQKAVFNINENDAVAAQTIIDHIQSPKKLIISDACQSYLEADHYLDGIGDVDQYMKFRSSVTKLRARRLFNEAVLDNPDGAQILMSCSRGQESVLSPTGSFFSYALLTSSQNWSDTNSHESVLTTLQAGKMASSFLKMKYSPDLTNQKPSCLVTKLRPNFPIGVKHDSLQLLY